MRIFVTRHGQTDWNKEGKVQGKTEIDLNEEGRKQAKELGEVVKELPLDLIVSSPLKRAIETANLLDRNNLPIITDERLAERNFGEYEGRNIKEEEELFYKLRDYHLNLPVKGGEDAHTFYRRIQVFLDDIKEKHNGKNILIVSHGGTSRMIKYYFEGIPEKGEVQRDTLGNCKLVEYEM